LGLNVTIGCAIWLVDQLRKWRAFGMNIVMTGGTSGFGSVTAKELAQSGQRVTLGARSPGVNDDATTYCALDLEDAVSVAEFARTIVSGPPIDALLLNAGIQLAKPATLPNGIEKTFYVNHLAHIRLLHRVLDSLPDGARVILTGSGTHDPAEKTPVTPPEHADANRLAYPQTDPTLPKSARKQAFRAYSSSKLANIMTARHLSQLRPDLSVMAYDPGYVPWTGLGRANGTIIAAIASFVIPRLMAGDRSSTVALSGRYLAELATGPAYANERGSYWSVRNPALVATAPSPLARDDAAAAKLWDDSLALLDLTETAAR
jgi:NAD(P)-dependent dehydrogenase (short-subunit alcohol dehydrogenase family)